MIEVHPTNTHCACEPIMTANTQIVMEPGVRGPDRVVLDLCPFCVAELHEKLGARLEQLREYLKMGRFDYKVKAVSPNGFGPSSWKP